MKCPLCGALIPDGNLDCPQCKIAQTNTQTVDQLIPNPPVQSDQSFATAEHAIPTHGVQPTQAPIAIPSMPPSKKKSSKIWAIGVVTAFLAISIMLYSVTTIYSTVQHFMEQPFGVQQYQNSNAQMTLNPYTKQPETLTIDDPLHDNSLGNKYNYHWMDDINDGNGGVGSTTSGCYFSGQQYHVSTVHENSQDSMVYCITQGARFSNFTYQVQMTVKQGHYGGIIFRQTPQAHFYAFVISDAGDYVLFTSSKGTTKVLAKGTSSSINQKDGMSNLLAVVANGSQLDLYVNQQQLTNVADSTYSVGIIGMIALGDDTSPGAIMSFNNAKIWSNPTNN